MAEVKKVKTAKDFTGEHVVVVVVVAVAAAVAVLTFFSSRLYDGRRVGCEYRLRVGKLR